MDSSNVRPTSPDDLDLPVAIVRPEKEAKIPRPIPVARNFSKTAPVNIPDKLCGWLVRHKRKGLFKSADRKWFDFIDNRCRLYSFQGSNDSSPQESLDIARSAITVEPEYSEVPGVFSLRQVGRSVNLWDSSLFVLSAEILEKGLFGLCRHPQTTRCVGG